MVLMYHLYWIYSCVPERKQICIFFTSKTVVSTMRVRIDHMIEGRFRPLSLMHCTIFVSNSLATWHHTPQLQMRQMCPRSLPHKISGPRSYSIWVNINWRVCILQMKCPKMKKQQLIMTKNVFVKPASTYVHWISDRIGSDTHVIESHLLSGIYDSYLYSYSRILGL